MSGHAEQRQPGGAPLTAWIDPLLVVSVGAYAVLLAGLMVAHGVALTLDVALVALALVGVLAVRTREGIAIRLPEPVRELLPLGVLFLAYELMRGYTAAGVGIVHIEDVLAVERWLFLGWLPTQVLQQAFHVPGETDLVAMTATLFYFLHFMLPFAVGAILGGDGERRSTSSSAG